VQVWSAVSKNLRMLRAAWRMRCSFSTMAMTHVVVAVLAQNRRPGATATSAFSTRSFENSRLPRERNISGILTQANMEAVGRGIGPAGLAEGVDQHVAAALVDGAHLADAVVGPVQRAVAAPARA
jgi:hypothetical protein